MLEQFRSLGTEFFEAYEHIPCPAINTCRSVNLQSIVGEEQCKDIVTEYLRRRGDGYSDVFMFHDHGREAQGETGLHAYMKPKEDETFLAGSKKTSKTIKQKPNTPEVQGNSPQGGLAYCSFSFWDCLYLQT